MLPPEILRQVRRIEILTNRIVNETMSGFYHSVFKGQGIEFEEVREYAPGDDIRAIDWNVTARTGRPYIKRFVEERELTVMLIVDLSRSMAFGSGEQLKQRLATELCAVLAFSAVKNHDKVGLVIFTDRIEHFIPPKKGTTHALRLIRDVLSFQPKGSGTDIPSALRYLNRVVRRKAVTFLISDFLADDLQSSLAVTNRRHDLIAVQVTDPREDALPDVGWIRLEDAETAEPAVINTALGSVREAYGGWRASRRKQALDAMRTSGVDRMEIRTGAPYVEELLRFFRMRARRRAVRG